jgi:hypothetical protein
MPCRVCGRLILLVSADDAPEIADRAGFLAVHRECLAAKVPAQLSRRRSS